MGEKRTTSAAGTIPAADAPTGVVIPFPSRLPAKASTRPTPEDYLEAHGIIDEGMADLWKPQLNDNEPT